VDVGASPILAPMQRRHCNTKPLDPNRIFQPSMPSLRMIRLEMATIRDLFLSLAYSGQRIADRGEKEQP